LDIVDAVMHVSLLVQNFQVYPRWLSTTAWKPEEWIIQCKTCVFEFDEVAGLCSSCDAEVLSACRQKDHQLVAMKCRQKMKDGGVVGPTQEIQVMVECTECPSRQYTEPDFKVVKADYL
jgi:predicted Zn-ribbon and HTH transcriptional regulator